MNTNAVGWAALRRAEANIAALTERLNAQTEAPANMDEGDGFPPVFRHHQHRPALGHQSSYLARKAVAPPRFTGHESHLRPQLWLRKCDAFFTQCHSLTSPGSELVNFATSLLDGPAAAWWDACSLEASVHADDIPSCINDWDIFKTTFMRYFTLPGQEDADRDRLDTCRQRTSVATYNAEFMHLIVLVPDNSDKWIMHKYLKGLKSPMQEMVKLTRPTSLTHAMEQAIEVESTRQRPYQKYSDFRQNHRFSHQSHMGVAPMELDNMYSVLNNLDEGTTNPADPPQYMDETNGPAVASTSQALNALDKDRKPPSPCPICKGMHWKSDCPRNTNKRSRFPARSNLLCHNCKQAGHKKNQCTMLRSNPN